MKILLTAFDPFGGERTNAALEAQRHVPDEVAGAEIVKLTVPTVFDTCVETVVKAVQTYKPNAVLCLGQATGRRELTPERVAINVDDARIPDNAGAQPTDRPIDPNGPAAYFSTLPIKAMVSAMRDVGLPAAVSNTAGTFVCNHLMYGILHALDIPGGFMHVPAIPEQVCDKPDMFALPTGEIARGVTAALAAIIENL